MEEAPRGLRLPEDEELFKHPTDDQAIVPDRMSASVEGYFRIPAVWIGDAPKSQAVATLNPEIHHAVVFRKQLACGIDACVFRDGTFLFDFTSWSLAPQIRIPGYRILIPQGAHRPPNEHSEAAQKAEDYALIRAQVMNVHQLCLITAERLVRGRGAGMGFPITPWNTFKGISFDAPPYYDDVEDVRALARNVMNNKVLTCLEALPRRVLELDVVEVSLNLLDRLLSAREAALIPILETYYLASCRNLDKRFGEALMLAWGVCEQLLSLMWKRRLDEIRRVDKINATDDTHARMSRKRHDKLLNGKDFTISIVTEILELEGRVPHEFYRLLEVARKARNDWMHKLKAPSQREVFVCLQAAQSLLRGQIGITLEFASGGRGGVPQWNVWVWSEPAKKGIS